MAHSLLSQQVYKILPRVPAGRVTTYKALAVACGSQAYRAIGQILHRNPYAPQVPCHRVVASDGTLGGFAWGVEKKIEMLRDEGVEIKDGRVDLKKFGVDLGQN